jgi:DNA repair protein RadA/Sms
MTKPKRVRSPAYVCTSCLSGHQRWPGAMCPTCGAFSTSIVALDEACTRGMPLPVTLLGDETRASRQRWATGLAAFDRILSHEGGIAPAASVLLASCPGGGKTTLLMAACGVVAQRRRALYISAEQDVAALRCLAEKLGVADRDRLLPVARQNVEDVARLIVDTAPALAVVDSANELAKQSGRQVGEVIGILHGVAHEPGGPAIFITSHVNAAGLVRGGPELEHATDTVLMMTGDPRKNPRRELAASKNRHGDTTITTALTMTEHGLVDVPDDGPAIPRRALGPGCALAIIPGADGRPVVIEVEAMIAPRAGGERRLIASGITRERLATLIAVIERELGTVLDGDVTVRAGSGAVEADAAVVAALVGASRGAPWPPSVAFCGVVRLDGTVAATSIDVAAEAQGMGCRWIGRPGEKLIAALDRSHLRAV